MSEFETATSHSTKTILTMQKNVKRIIVTHQPNHKGTQNTSRTDSSTGWTVQTRVTNSRSNQHCNFTAFFTHVASWHVARLGPNNFIILQFG